MDILTRDEAAAYLKLSARTVHLYSAKGFIPTLRYAGRLMFDREALDHWVRTFHRKPLTQAQKERFAEQAAGGAA
jgi:excisionase family DNA binding protein